MDTQLSQMTASLEGAMLTGLTGGVVQTIGLMAAVADFPAPVGALVQIARPSVPSMDAEVIGFRD